MRFSQVAIIKRIETDKVRIKMERELPQIESVAECDRTLAVVHAFFASLVPCAKPPKIDMRKRQPQEIFPQAATPRVILSEPGINTLPVQPS
jgi:hypothetical protein